jgi:glycosyltransferase involved in cell wall biosynthesis
MNADNVLVSVICDVYNHEPYLRDCLEGFINQKANFTYEILIHDDASTDNSVNIIKEYVNKYPHLFKPIFQTENQYSKGMSIWYDIQIPRAKGKYIAICEGDDYWIDPYKLQKQVDFMEENIYVVACCHNAFQVFENERRLFVNVNNASHYIVLEEMLCRWQIPTASLLYRREVLKGKECLLGKYVNGDYALELTLLSCGRFYYDDSIMSVYRMHADSVSANLNKRQTMMYSQIIKLLDDAKRLYMENDYKYFDNAINNYKTLIIETTLLNHPLKKWFNRKTYTRWLKKKVIKILNS